LYKGEQKDLVKRAKNSVQKRTAKRTIQPQKLSKENKTKLKRRISIFELGGCVSEGGGGREPSRKDGVQKGGRDLGRWGVGGMVQPVALSGKSRNTHTTRR